MSIKFLLERAVKFQILNRIHFFLEFTIFMLVSLNPEMSHNQALINKPYLQILFDIIEFFFCRVISCFSLVIFIDYFIGIASTEKKKKKKKKKNKKKKKKINK